MACYCDKGWVCEQHPGQPWPHDDCPGPRMLCADPNCIKGRVRRAERNATREPERQKN